MTDPYRQDIGPLATKFDTTPIWTRTSVRRYEYANAQLALSPWSWSPVGVSGSFAPRSSPSAEIAWSNTPEDARYFYVQPHLLQGLVARVLHGMHHGVHVMGQLDGYVYAEPEPAYTARALRELERRAVAADLSVATMGKVKLRDERSHSDVFELTVRWRDREHEALYLNALDLFVGLDNAMRSLPGSALPLPRGATGSTPRT